MATTSSTRLLQHESNRLRKEVEALEENKRNLYRYFELIKNCYWLRQTITTADNPLQKLYELLYEVVNVVGARDGSLSQLDDVAGELVFILVHGDLRHRLRGFRITSDTGIAGWVVSNREAIIVNHPRQDWRFSQQVDQEFSFLTQSIMSVPVIDQHGKLVGVSQLLNKIGGEFDEADEALLLIFGQIAALVLNEIEVRIEAGPATEADFPIQDPEETAAPSPKLTDTSRFDDPAFADMFLKPENE